MSDLSQLSGAELAAMVKGGKLKPLELVAHLERRLLPTDGMMAVVLQSGLDATICSTLLAQQQKLAAAGGEKSTKADDRPRVRRNQGTREIYVHAEAPRGDGSDRKQFGLTASAEGWEWIFANQAVIAACIAEARAVPEETILQERVAKLAKKTATAAK